MIKITFIDKQNARCYNRPRYFEDIFDAKFGKNVGLEMKRYYIVKSVTSNQKSTRETILYAIKTNPQSKIEDLAVTADVSPVTVRHHLNGLQADGLISVESVRRKVGRPYYVYSITDKGNEQFPTKYFSLANRLLAELKNQLPPETVNEIFIGLVKSIVEEHKGEFEALTFEQRLDYLTDILADEGFIAQWEKTKQGYRITEYSCPYISVGQKHDEVCTLDTSIMLTVLGTEVEQQSCMLNGDECCQFDVAHNNSSTITFVE